MAAGSSQNVFRWYVAFGGFLCTSSSLLSDSLWSYSFFASLFKLFCLKNVRHQTAVSRQLTACTTLIYYFDTYDTRFHSLAFPPLLLGDCHQALWVGTRSKTQKMAMKIARTLSPASPSSVLKCPITSTGQLDYDVLLLQLKKVLQFVVFLCKLGLLIFKPKQDLQTFKKEKTKCSQMSSSWKWPIGQSSVWSWVSQSSQACICYVFYFNFILKLLGVHLLHSFYLQFILHFDNR